MKRLLFPLLMLLVLFSIPAGAEQIHEIRTPQDLMDIALDPAGHYILMNDLDAAGLEWVPPDFSGILDGNGHAILNLMVSSCASSRALVRDGNLQEYEAGLSGLFGRLEHAQIRDLNLVNFRACIETEDPFFLGGFAGWSEESSVIGCSLSGILELRAHNGMFGIAGALGYGTGSLENCRLDTILICVDTDAGTRDEQFLGGAFGAGFFTIRNSTVGLDAYISEHGYVHSGGIIGMLVQYPMGIQSYAVLTGNTVSGRIRFFEDNSDRRAYCGAEAGEIDRAYGYTICGNDTQSFLRDEVRSFDSELRPEACTIPEYTVETIAPLPDRFGYTRYTCTVCGYSETDRYTLYS